MGMTHDEWMKSLDLPPGVGVSTSEAFQAGRDSYEAEITQIWNESKAMGEFAEDVASRIGEL